MQRRAYHSPWGPAWLLDPGLAFYFGADGGDKLSIFLVAAPYKAVVSTQDRYMVTCSRLCGATCILSVVSARRTVRREWDCSYLHFTEKKIENELGNSLHSYTF